MLSITTAAARRTLPAAWIASSSEAILQRGCRSNNRMSTTTTTVTTLSDLDAVEKFTQLNSKCVIYYTATWCGPCKAIKPVYEKMAGDYANQIALGKVDVDDNPDAAAAVSVSAVPTFMAFHNNEGVAQFAGADQTQLSQMLTALNEKK